MILSVSRRTDVPAFYADWFMNRVRDGRVFVRDSFNANQISDIPMSPDIVDCIVFWTEIINNELIYDNRRTAAGIAPCRRFLFVTNLRNPLTVDRVVTII